MDLRLHICPLSFVFLEWIERGRRREDLFSRFLFSDSFSSGSREMFITRCSFFCVSFFIVFLTHMHQWLVFATCTRYRSNADDSTLSNCCCRSMALLNFSTHIRLINQMRPLVVYFSLSTGKCLSIIGNMFFASDIETVYTAHSVANKSKLSDRFSLYLSQCATLQR